MNSTIDHIETAGPDRRARRLVFGPDVQPRTTSAAAVKSLGIAEGDVLDDQALYAVEADLARDRALNYLGYRERSAHEVTKRLVDDGYPIQLAHRIVSRFRELGLIDDERLARMWARSRAASGHGRRRVERELVRRGIDQDLAMEAAGEACCDEVESARHVLRGKTAATRSDRQRLIRKLLRRGFDLSTALEATASLENGADDRNEDTPFVGE